MQEFSVLVFLQVQQPVEIRFAVFYELYFCWP